VARREALDLLTDGRLDAAIGFFPSLPEGFTADLLYLENYAVVARRGHRVAGRNLTMAQYLSCRHVLVSLGGDFRGVVDGALARRGLGREVVATLPMFLPALAVVADTDLIATVPRRLAERHARRFGLAVLKPPLAIRDFSVSTVIHRRMADDPATSWLRKQLVGLFADRKR
jgi:LysR family transcriptional regulator, mexEF-oprN operon transcriptional activator